MEWISREYCVTLVHVFLWCTQLIKDASGLRCYVCDNEHSNVHCVGDMNLHDCEEGFDTCQTIVAYSDVIEKLSNIKTCTKNTSCYLQSEEKQMTKDLQVTCDNTRDNWICTDCCYDDGCNINMAGNYEFQIPVLFLSLATSLCVAKYIGNGE